MQTRSDVIDHTRQVSARLNLDDAPLLNSVAFGNHKVATFISVTGICDLPYRANRVNNGRTSRVGHKAFQRFKLSAANSLRWQCQQVFIATKSSSMLPVGLASMAIIILSIAF